MNASFTTPETPQGCIHLKLRQFMRRVAQPYDAELAKVQRLWRVAPDGLNQRLGSGQMVQLHTLTDDRMALS